MPAEIIHDYVPQKEGHPSYMTGGHHLITRIETSNTHVTMGDMKFEREHFTRAFEGTLRPGFGKAPSRKFADPSGISLGCFGILLLANSLTLIEARGVTNNKALGGLFIFYGGVLPILCGMWAVALENTWGALVQTSFGCFWLTNGFVVLDIFNVIGIMGFADMSSFMGLWGTGWSIFSLLVVVTTLRSTWTLFLIFFGVTLCNIFNAAQWFFQATNHDLATRLNKTGGYFGILTSLVCFWGFYGSLATKENSYWVPPVYFMPGAILSNEKMKEKLAHGHISYKHED